ncbi:MAG TPA: hypothetical protein QGH10_19445, partial [Armatimonadota bacterium]|nr:hypothetical protein [Armatimonadota bacterium]
MNHKLRTWATWLACALFVFVLAPIVALACETPVYEYTIHMWQRDPYRVWYFHDGGEDPADKPVNDLLDAALDRDANLSFLSVDINKLDDVGYQFQREVYEAHKDQPLPLHVLLTPRGTAMGAERLTVESAKALMDSPKRRQMNELLCEGKQGGMVLLLGENDQANTDARQAVEAAAEEAKADGQDVGVTEVSRDDPAERWHVEQLLNLEDDLHEFDEPMVFGMFGRGHALEPYLGRGITRENLMELVSFMGGPCSCEIKATAPGLDILTQLDWESELENWTSKDPDQLAADTGLGGYVEITIPAVTPEDDPDEPNQTEPVE